MADTIGVPRWPTNTTGTNGLVSGDDYNGLRNTTNRWVSIVLDEVNNRLDLPSSGNYFVSYVGAQTLHTIQLPDAADDAAVINLSADPVAAAGNLTILHNVGNIKTNRGLAIVLTSREWIVQLIQVGGVYRAWVPYGD